MNEHKWILPEDGAYEERFAVYPNPKEPATYVMDVRSLTRYNPASSLVIDDAVLESLSILSYHSFEAVRPNTTVYCMFIKDAEKDNFLKDPVHWLLQTQVMNIPRMEYEFDFDTLIGVIK